MSLSARRRQFLLGCALVATLVATLAATALSSSRDEENAVVQPVIKKALDPSAAQTAPISSATTASLRLEKLERRTEPREVSDLFAPRSWVSAPSVPKPAREAPAAPAAPPLPFAYVGQFEDGAKVMFFVVKGDTVYPVAVGEVIEEHYRLESASAAQLTFVYLPLNQKQVLAIPQK